MGAFGIVSVAARAAFVLAALAVTAAAAITLADVFMRYVAGAPMQGAFEYAETAMTLAVLVGAPAALYIYRDPAIPAGPRWAGRGGTAAALLVFAAFSGLILYFVFEKFGFKDDGERSISAELPATLIARIALYVCFAILLLLQARLIAEITSGAAMSAPLPWALVLGLVAMLGCAVANGIGPAPAVTATLIMAASGGASNLGLPVIAAGAIGGAIAALRPATGIAAVAAPLATVLLAALALDASISTTALALVVPALIMTVLHAALGAWRGWRGMTDDLIGLGILVVTALFLIPGIFTPSEFAGFFGLILVGILTLIALILRPAGGIARPLARGLAYGLGALFAIVMFLPLANVTVFLGLRASLAIPGVLEGPLGFAIALALGLGFGALCGSAIGCLLTGYIVAALAAKANDPVLMATLVALMVMAGAAFHPWLARRLAGSIPGSDNAPRLGPAVLAAVPPAATAALMWFAPDIAFRFIA